jgi:D-glycero-beta-D-manno-heptose-7-phosphate kinase
MEKIQEKKLKQAIGNLKNVRILVLGDLILDEYLIGEVNRISPEAPVPVVWIRKEEITLGGAGNVVKNLHTLGTNISVIGRSGKDEKGKQLLSLLKQESIAEKDIFLLQSSQVPTILKTRILAGHQQVCRVDREENHPLTTEEEDSILKHFRSILPDLHGVILSDYDKGVFTPNLIAQVLQDCKEHNTLVTVDPQVSHFFRYHNASILTPNHHEAGKAIGYTLDDDKSIEKACFDIAEKIDPSALMITRGEKGMSVYKKSDRSITHIPTVAREVFDVTGAGDTVITTYTAFHAAGLDEVEAALVSNAAAGVVVGKLGAATASIDEIMDKLSELEVIE